VGTRARYSAATPSERQAAVVDDLHGQVEELTTD
jgi:hypothetical protein